MLDPELAAAYKAGNSSIVQAVAGGATTTQMVVNDMIRAGVTTGLPPGVQELVTARLKEIAQQTASSHGGFSKTAAEAAGWMAATGAPASEYYGGPSERNWTTNPPNSAEFSHMNLAEQAAYLDSVKRMSMESWLGLEQPQRLQHIDNTQQDGAQKMQGAADESARISEEISAKYSKADAERIHAVGDGLDLRDAAQVKLAQERLRALGQSHPDLAGDAQRLLASNIEMVNRAQQAGTANEAKTEELGGNSPGAKTKVDEAITHGQQGTQAAADVLCMSPNESSPQVRAAAVKADAAQAAFSEDLKAGIAQQPAAAPMAATLTANLETRISTDAVAVAAANRRQAEDEFGEVPSPVASTAPRLTINATPLQAAGMVQEQGVVAANDPIAAASAEAPVAPQEQRRPAATLKASGVG